MPFYTDRINTAQAHYPVRILAILNLKNTRSKPIGYNLPINSQYFQHDVFMANFDPKLKTARSEFLLQCLNKAQDYSGTH